MDEPADWSWLQDPEWIVPFVGAFVAVWLLGRLWRRITGSRPHPASIWLALVLVGGLMALVGKLLPDPDNPLVLTGGILAVAGMMFGIRWFFTGDVTPRGDNTDDGSWRDEPAEQDLVD